MPGLVLELQRAAMEENTNVSDLLRKAFVVARKLGVSEFQEWINLELNGYGKDHKVPDYRIIKGDLKAWNPYHGYVPVIIQNPDEAERLSRMPIGQSVGELVSLEKPKDKRYGDLQVRLPAHIERKLMDGMGVPLKPTLLVSHSELHGILDSVRNIILEWSLKLEEEGISGEGMTFTKEEKQKANKATEIHIGTFQGILGNVNNSTVTQSYQNDITKYDFDSLAEYFQSLGVSSFDIEELKAAIESQPMPSSPEDYNEKTNNWIGKMISKSASGAWSIGVGAAGGVIARALGAFFGF